MCFAVRMLTAGETAPELNLADQDGNMISLKSFAGRRVCIYFLPQGRYAGLHTGAFSRLGLGWRIDHATIADGETPEATVAP